MERHGPTRTPSPRDDDGRSATPMTPAVLKKALLPISGPDEDSEQVERSHSSDTDVSAPEFEGYLDILSYLQRDLPDKPARSRATPSPPMVQVTLKTPREEEWMSSSCRSPSQSSMSNFTSRSRSAAGGSVVGLSRTNSYTTKTVTPMSSVDSDSELRLHGKQAVPARAESRIEEVSEPETASPHGMTPKRRSPTGAAPSKCFHCGRDPCGPDPQFTNSSFVTVLNAFQQDERRRKSLPDPEPEPEPQSEPEHEKRATGPSIAVEDAQGRRYLLYPQTSFYEAVEDSDSVKELHDGQDDEVYDEDFEGDIARPHSLCQTALECARRDILYALGEAQNETKFWDDDDEDEEENDENEEDSDSSTPTAPLADPYERPFNPDPYSSLDSPSFSDLLDEQFREDHQDEDEDEASELGRESHSPQPTFWKDPDGVIVVYKGIEVNGKQMFYGADINYLGSFYDEEEDSSGLGSSHHSPTNSFGNASTALCMIPETSFSDDQLDEEVCG